MKILDIPLDSWAAFKHSLVNELGEDGYLAPGRFLFRGVAASEWALVASLDRLHSHLDTKERLELLKDTLNAFREEYLLAHGTELSGDDLELQSLGQHYGLATRLLDWSESPYVGAYFAFESLISRNPASRYAAVWALDRTNSAWSGETGCQIVGRFGQFNERSRPQKGHFTYLRATVDSLEEYVDGCHGSNVGLWKFLIPTRERHAVMSDLDLMGLSGRSLFPDMTGLVKAATVKAALMRPIF